MPGCAVQTPPAGTCPPRNPLLFAPAPADTACACHCRQRTRLAEALLAAPSRTDRYFDDHPGRRYLWLAISFAAGVPMLQRTMMCHWQSCRHLISVARSALQTPNGLDSLSTVRRRSWPVSVVTYILPLQASTAPTRCRYPLAPWLSTMWSLLR